MCREGVWPKSGLPYPRDKGLIQLIEIQPTKT